MLICMSFALQPGTLKPLFSLLADAISKETKPSVWGDNFLRIILINLPYFIAANNDLGKKDFANEILDQCEIYVRHRKSSITLSNPLSIHDNLSEEELDLLYKQLILSRENDFTFPYISQPWKFFESDFVHIVPVSPSIPEWTFQPTPQQNELPSFKRFFELFNNFEIRTTPDASDVAASIFRDISVDVINHLEFNRVEAAQVLTDLDVYFTYKTFALRGTPVNELPNLDPSESRWKAEDIIVEAVLGELLGSQNTTYKPVYYHSLLIECCRIAPKILAPTFGRVIRLMYTMSSDLPLQTLDRFIDWFSHHLSNFNFHWKWNEWIPDVELDDLHPKKVFMRETITRELILSYYTRISDSLPEELRCLLGEQPSGPNFVYENETHPLYQQSSQIIEALRLHKPLEELDIILQSEEIQNSETSAVRLVMSCAYSLGSRSFSHALNVFEKHLNTLKHFSRKSLDSEIEVVDELFSFWKLQPFNAVMWLDKMLNYSIISITSIIEWLIKQDVTIWSRSYTWSLVNTTFNKLAARLRRSVSNKEDSSLINEANEEKEIVTNLLLSALRALISENAENIWVSHWLNLMLKYVESNFLSVKKDTIEEANEPVQENTSEEQEDTKMQPVDAVDEQPSENNQTAADATNEEK